MEKQNGKKIVVGLLAHVDAGKTTLAEAMLYTAGSLAGRGRVDEKNSLLDTDAFERKRGITAFSKQAVLQTGNTSISLLDTPGHADLYAETERVVSVLDYAVLVINGGAGIQADTVRLWQVLQNQRIPTFLFISKMDLETANSEKLFAEIREKLSLACVNFSGSQTERDEQAAEASLICLEPFLDQGVIPVTAYGKAIQQREIFPCFFGSGLKLIGIDAFLHFLDTLTVSSQGSEHFSAKVYKISRDEKGNRLTFAKINGGVLRVRDSVFCMGDDDSAVREKITEIRLYNGAKYLSVPFAEGGEICALTGLTHTFAGSILGEDGVLQVDSGHSSWRYRVLLPEDTDRIEAEKQLSLLEEEFPEFAHHTDGLGFSVSLSGKMQEEMFLYLLDSRFGLSAELEQDGVEWKETISKVAEGVGHFEPLRHYAEVHLVLQPLPRGSGIQIESICPEDMLDRKWQNQILDVLTETKVPGVLIGAELDDIRIQLASARIHLKHTDGGDIRQAALRALRQGLMKAEPQLLEPLSRFYITIPAEWMGRVMSDLKERHAQIEKTESDGLAMTMIGTIPSRFSLDYRDQLRALSHGQGSIVLHPDGYIPCIHSEKIIANYSYIAERDPDYPVGSVFCAHGAGFSVGWNEVEEYMHLPSVLQQKESKTTQDIIRPVSIDDRELEAIMLREFGPIRRAVYSSPISVGERKPTQTNNHKPKLCIVDGYNYIFSQEDLKTLSKKSLETARTALTESLINYSGFTGTQVILVFDGYRSRGNIGSKTDTVNIHVVFTKENETADAYIERILYEIGKNESVSVVTGDRLIQLSAFHSGVLRISTDEFHQILSDCFQNMQAELEKSREKEHKLRLQDVITN